jgi:predicted nuclease of predicted toxin-antitoxin system
MFRVELAEHLRSQGHDVVRAAEVGLNRADDDVILAKAIAEKRVLITLDEHFGDWAVLPLAAHPGVIRVKVNPATTENVLQILAALLSGRSAAEFHNQLVIASRGRARWRRSAG